MEFHLPDQTPKLPKQNGHHIGASNRDITYACSVCGRNVGKLNLRVKKAQFFVLGTNGKCERSRVTGWLCITPHSILGHESKGCLFDDPEYNLPERVTAPGTQDTKSSRAARGSQ